MGELLGLPKDMIDVADRILKHPAVAHKKRRQPYTMSVLMTMVVLRFSKNID